MINTTEKVINITQLVLRAERSTVTLEASLREDLKGSQIELLELGQMLGSYFDIVIPNVDMDKLKTVKDVVNYIENEIKYE